MVDKEEQKEMWSIDDLISLTDKVQTSEITFRKKNLTFQYCELTEKEEPAINLSEELSEEEKNAYYMEVGTGRVKAMIDKANKKNPEGATISADNWSSLPSTLRFSIANEIMGLETDVSENFTIG